MRTILTVIALLTVGCGEFVDDSRALKAVETAGYTKAVITGKHGMAAGWNGCGKDDAVAFDIAATNPIGKPVAITVCCGLWMKSCTIRQ